MRNVVSLGELNDEMLILENVTPEGTDENGFPLPEEIVTIADLYCKVKTISTREFIEADRGATTLQYKFIVLRDDIPVKITSAMYISYDEQRWNIKHIHKMDDYHFEITAELYS